MDEEEEPAQHNMLAEPIEENQREEDLEDEDEPQAPHIGVVDEQPEEYGDEEEEMEDEEMANMDEH